MSKKAINLRLEESVIYTLNQLANELNTTKTDIIERSIQFFSKHNNIKQNRILKYAGKLKAKDADEILKDIKTSKTSKDISLDI